MFRKRSGIEFEFMGVAPRDRSGWQQNCNGCAIGLVGQHILMHELKYQLNPTGSDHA